MTNKLVAPDKVYYKKMWNHGYEFKIYLSDRGIPALLFAYKDQRFGCPSRAAGVVLSPCTVVHIRDFLDDHPQLTNRYESCCRLNN